MRFGSNNPFMSFNQKFKPLPKNRKEDEDFLNLKQFKISSLLSNFNRLNFKYHFFS